MSQQKVCVGKDRGKGSSRGRAQLRGLESQGKQFEQM